jgi:hypothetical protein
MRIQNEGARLRELALMAELYDQQNQRDKAEEVISWSPVLEELKEVILSAPEESSGLSDDLAGASNNAGRRPRLN